uniref:KIAA0040 n=2 Tax=Pygocentrus nattereri TaxID=42514 RepID=A0A3B4CDK4_PYGNA
MAQITEFFNDLWRLATAKHNEGIYNTVCLMVLLTLPLVVFFTSLIVCCHCCFCRGADGCSCCCRRDGTTVTSALVENKKKKKNKKKNGGQTEEDLWISVKTDPMTPDRVALTIV